MAPRRRLAWLGIAAILLQTFLLGWHHHTQLFPARGTAATLSAPAPGGATSPAAVDSACEICVALHHHAAAPAAPIGQSVPPLVAVSHPGPARFALAPPDYRAFHSRAPPRV